MSTWRKVRVGIFIFRFSPLTSDFDVSESEVVIYSPHIKQLKDKKGTKKMKHINADNLIRGMTLAFIYLCLAILFVAAMLTPEKKHAADSTGKEQHAAGMTAANTSAGDIAMHISF